jgi:hypothetical protein
MCVKIICNDHEHEFNPLMPLEDQFVGAKEVIVNYDPVDTKIDSFLDEVERLCRTGISCNVDIKVNANNYLNGIKLERHIEKLKLKLDVNEVVKGLTKFHSETDKKLVEIQEICLGRLDER